MSIPTTKDRDERSPLLTAPTPAPALVTAALSETPDLEHGATASSQHVAAIADANGAKAASPPNMMVIFPAITIGIFLAAADGTLVLVSYATISSELDALNLASWIMTAYILAMASFQPLYGKLSDIFGRKNCLLAAYSLFSLGCLACGFSQSIGQLIAARVLQAIGGSGLNTIVSILLTALVPPEDRGLWQGFLNIVYALGAGLGAPIGGLLAGTVGWRWSFFGQIPICLLAIVLVSICLTVAEPVKIEHQQSDLKSKLRRVDFLGAISLVVMISALILGLDRGSNVSWLAPECYLSLTICVLSALWFFYVETKMAREPIVPPSIVFSPQLLPVYLTSFFAFAAIMALDFTLPLYYQARRQFSPQKASFYMLPAIFAGVASALLTGFWMRRKGQYFAALLLACSLQITGGLGTLLFSGFFLESAVGLVVAQNITELGVGNSVVSGLIAVISNSSNTSVAILTALYYSIRNLGCVIGVSAVSTTIQQSLRSILLEKLQSYDLDVEKIIEELRVFVAGR
ncbi:major facilitator superfamily domain-containing protein [Stachybotrys elegans]|uniref:Major facilitator superfamily domain-containing protein n=1 Tax=Stachybotrys elegans TaxID=80388 RepID=A0A8K0SWZ4_9HYPO|nr:major facilitator superfamily domain-containing protein [Stachybotrys elegans]